MSQALKTFHRPRKLLAPLAAAFLILLGTAPVAWGEKTKSRPSSGSKVSRPSSPRPSARPSSRPSARPSARPSSRPSARPSSRPKVRPSAPRRSAPRVSRPSSTAPRPKTVVRPRPATPRTDVPRVDRPERPGKSPGPWHETSPPRGGGGFTTYKPGGDGGGGHHGGGYRGGGHHRHYPYYYRHYPYYWGGYGHYYNPSYYFGLGYGYGYFGLGYGYWPSFYYHPYYPRYYPRYSYGRSVRYEPQGALDLNVKPKDTQVYLNGYFIGTTGDFDGWPNYLWLDEDSHELIFYKEGYTTVVREIAVRPEVVLNIKFRMQPGPTVEPEKLTRYKDRESDREEYASRDPREYREREYREQQERDRARSYEPAPPREPAAAEAPKPVAPPAPPGGIDMRTEPGRLQLTISPAEASVYLDGRFVGIGGELSALTAGLLMDPGEHRIQVFHPGHETREATFTIEVGKESKLDIDLTK